MKHSRLCLAVLLAGFFALTPVAIADDAKVLPKGIFRFTIDGMISLPITKRFTKEGDKEDIAADFNANLNSQVFSDLSLVEAGFGLPPGSATFGRSVVDFERHIQIYNFQLAYGLTDKLSIGVNVPYWNQKIDVKARLDNTGATVGFNPLVPGGVAPIGFAGTSAPTTNDIQNFLASQGFRRVDDWSGNAFGDILAGARYQYYKSKNWLLAASAGVRFPTGKWDNPNNLVDNNTGFDAWGLRLQLQQDYVHQAETNVESPVLLPGDFFINTVFSYDPIFPDKKPFRVCNVHRPICPDFDDNVRRNVGDIFELGISGTVGLLLRGLSASAHYTYEYKMKDNFKGDRGFDYDALVIESDYRSHIVEAKISYSTLAQYLEKKFPIPLTVTLGYRDRVAGRNNQFNSHYIGFSLESYF
jgi:hypothetical protein